jgi:hypothetical protein
MMMSISIEIAIVFLMTLLFPDASFAFIQNSDGCLHLPHNIARGGGNNNQYSNNKSSSLNLLRSAQEATAEAEYICHVEGPHSERCKVAWDIVEELKAADSHDRTQSSSLGPSELSYSPLVLGLDVLSNKIDKKMDELRKLSTELAGYGAGPEVERLIYASDEMKQILQDARTAMDQYR